MLQTHKENFFSVKWLNSLTMANGSYYYTYYKCRTQRPLHSEIHLKVILIKYCVLNQAVENQLTVQIWVEHEKEKHFRSNMNWYKRCILRAHSFTLFDDKPKEQSITQSDTLTYTHTPTNVTNFLYKWKILKRRSQSLSCDWMHQFSNTKHVT